MNSSDRTIGNKIVAVLRSASQCGAITQNRPQTLADLLQVIRALVPAPQTSMMRSAAVLVSNWRNLPFEKILISSLFAWDYGFGDYLRERRYSPNSVRAYRYQINLLVRCARELVPDSVAAGLREQWDPILAVLPQKVGCSLIVRYALTSGKSPAEFGDADLEAWEQESLERGLKVESVSTSKRRFRRAIVDARLQSRFPFLSYPPSKCSHYGVATKDFPEPLRTEVLELLRWKQDAFAIGRHRRSKLRPITART